MKLQEVAQQVQMTKRAIKYYEEKGLLQVEKDENGYRRYTEEHIAVLQQIQVYRKLGMELSAIQRILHDSQVEQEELQRLEEQMQRHLEQQSAQLEAVRQMLAGTKDYRVLQEQLDYQTIAAGNDTGLLWQALSISFSAVSADSHHDAGAAGCLSGNSHILGYNRPEDAAVYENCYISNGVSAKSAGRGYTGKAGCTAEKATGTECKAVRANEKGGSPSVSGSEILSASLPAFLNQ